MSITPETVEKVFIEWEKRKRENPDVTYIDGSEYETPEEYGKGAAKHFLTIMKELEA